MSTVGGRHSGCIVRIDRRPQRQVDPELLVGVQIPMRIAGRAAFIPGLIVYRGPEGRNDIPDASRVLVVVEVADPSRNYDRGVKLPRYAAAGIAGAWLLDLVSDKIERHSDPGPDGYRQVFLDGHGDDFASLICPTVQFSADSILGQPAA